MAKAKSIRQKDTQFQGGNINYNRVEQLKVFSDLFSIFMHNNGGDTSDTIAL